MVRFYIDADVGRTAVDLLADHGHDVQYSIDSGYGDEPDAFHFRHAATNRRVVVTMNAQDFRTLHRLWKTLAIWDVLDQPHAGVLTTSRRISAEILGSAIIQLLTAESDLAGRLFTWQAETGVLARGQVLSACYSPSKCVSCLMRR